MRLLSSSEVKKNEQHALDLEIKNISDLQDKERRLTEVTSKLESQYEQKKISLTNELDTLCKELTGKKLELLNEVESLEARKQEAKRPLDAYRVWLDDRASGLEKMKLELRDEAQKNEIDRTKNEQDRLKNKIELEEISKLKVLILEEKNLVDKIIIEAEEKKKGSEAMLSNALREIETKKCDLKQQENNVTLLLEKDRAERIIIEERIKELEKLREEVNIKLARTKYV